MLDARWVAAQILATICNGYEQLLAELPTLHCQRLLDDRRNSHLLKDELAEWMTTDWYLRAHRAGLRHHVVVFANDFFGHRTTKVVLARMDDGQLMAIARRPPAAGNCWPRRAAGSGKYPGCWLAGGWGRGII